MSEQKKPSALVRVGDRGVQLTTVEDLYRFANAVVQSELYKQWKQPEQVMVAIEAGLELGMRPVRALSMIYVPPGGKPSLMSEAMLALIRSHPECTSLEMGHRGGKKTRCAWIEFQRGHAAPVKVTYSIKEAQEVGLVRKWEHNISKGSTASIDDMLLARCVSRMAKRYWTDVILGLGVAEVERDIAASGPEAATPVAVTVVSGIEGQEAPPLADPLLEQVREAPERSQDVPEVIEAPADPKKIPTAQEAADAVQEGLLPPHVFGGDASVDLDPSDPCPVYTYDYDHPIHHMGEPDADS